MVRMQHFQEVSCDEQALANGYVQDVVYQSGVKYKIASSPIEMDSVGELKTVPAPGVGAHSAEILKSLGYTDAQLEKMEKDRIKLEFFGDLSRLSPELQELAARTREISNQYERLHLICLIQIKT